ncbi:proton-conducting transporter membrane subunit [Wenzhouxiangella sp. XN24]|uniref:proton-conducting transporter transmembrane domain-containing protein n=1 Tax=Wenzhouxiangella sp. XN24 TaxID=2713569 RepID=UPI0013EBAC32|nr:proton-conducting transporter membrane subunit [Wenzhouxiangella sp. XN24]NGX15131.1 hypothetical protein [Wenzhouxiangella sp. XN24]
MSLLLALPLLPLAAALWFAARPVRAPSTAGWVVALVAAFPVTVAALMAPDRIALPELLVMRDAALVLDPLARAALLLFGGLWLAIGLLLTRPGVSDPPVVALLVALSGTLALSLAEGGPMVYAGMLAAGYGLYAVMAGESGGGWRSAGRTWVVLLVASDLLVFEMLLSSTAHPTAGPYLPALVMALFALVLRGGIPPAHGWLAPALGAVSLPTAVLLAAVPLGAAVFGGLKILPPAPPTVVLWCSVLGLVGAAWATVAGLAQVEARTTLAYATAATGALLLAGLPLGGTAAGGLAWPALALLASCAVIPLLALQPAGWPRDFTVAVVLLVHGLAGGHAAAGVAATLPPAVALLLPFATVAATLLLTVAARRTAVAKRAAESLEAARVALIPLVLGVAGLLLAWLAEPPGFASAWAAPVGITLGLVAFRLMPVRTRPAVPPGDLLGPVERLVSYLLRRTRILCRRNLARRRDRTAAWLRSCWDGRAWSRRVQRLDLVLRAWPATSLMMLLVAMSAAFLLAK